MINLLLLKVLSSYVDDVGLVIGGLVLNSDSWCGSTHWYEYRVGLVWISEGKKLS